MAPATILPAGPDAPEYAGPIVAPDARRQALVDRWHRCTRRWDGDPVRAGGVALDLLRRHDEPHRRYHTVEHLDEVLRAIDRLAASARDRRAVELAAWFHDAVYDPAAPSGWNERASADLAREALAGLGVPAGVVAEVGRLVELTAGHGVDPGDADGAVLSDADLTILGAAPARYRRYVDDVRAEYGWVDDDAWRRGRSAILAGFLERPRLYVTAGAAAALEGPARRNLAAELAALAGSQAEAGGT